MSSRSYQEAQAHFWTNNSHIMIAIIKFIIVIIIILLYW